MKPDYAYLKTLDYFLQHSNADEVDVKWFIKTLPKYFPELWSKLQTKEPIRWLEVGPGPGIKTLEIARTLIEQFDARISFLALEPCPEWIAVYKANVNAMRAKGSQFTVRIVQTTWEEFSSGNQSQFDLITFFHSIYGIAIMNGILTSLKQLDRLLKPGGKACIVIESPTSALSNIKLKVFPWLYNTPAVSQREIEATLNRFEMQYRIDSGHAKQRFFVDDFFVSNSSEKLQLLSFIAQSDPRRYTHDVPPKVKQKIESYVREKIRNGRDGHYVDVSDVFMWVGKRGRGKTSRQRS